MGASDEAPEAKLKRAERTLSQAMQPSEQWQRDAGGYVFDWNSRECWGNELHRAVWDQDMAKVTSILSMDRHCVSSTFHYQTEFNHKKQEGSGQAIHLAVTRGQQDHEDVQVEILKLLLKEKADIEAMVTRGTEKHYNVLHAAVFCEGHGGQAEVVKLLLENKACHIRNKLQETPLHKAFQTGGKSALEVINLLRADMKARKIEEGIEHEENSPLKCGIENGAMSCEDLANAALLDTASIKTFLRDEPACIPTFCDRLRKDEVAIKRLLNVNISAQDSDQAVNGRDPLTAKDMVQAFRDSPESAMVILDCLMGAPEVENPGWHALPTRASFEPRTGFEKIRRILNPQRRVLTVYVRDKTWAYDAKSFQFPPWHANFMVAKPMLSAEEKRKMCASLIKFPSPVVDVEVKVCHVPNIVCAELFSALNASDTDEVFESRTMDAIVDTIWWGGAFRVDAVQFMISFLGVVLLVLDRTHREYLCEYGDSDIGRKFGCDDKLDPGDTTSRRLIVKGGAAKVLDRTMGLSLHKSVTETDMFGFTSQFIGARGVVDLLHEGAQVLGYWKMGRTSDYFTLGNAWDITRAVLCVVYWFDGWETISDELKAYTKHVAVFVILVFWFRLLEINFCQRVMCELLPLTSLVRGLAPSILVCFIAVMAFTHAKWVLDANRLWPDVVYESFMLLLTAGLPEIDHNYRKLAFSYLAVACFTVFFLNIFISVICASYSDSKDKVRNQFQRRKCGQCLSFLARAKVLPCRTFPPRMMTLISLACAILLIASIVAFAFLPEYYRRFALGWFAALQSLWLLWCYQDTDDLWTTSHRSPDQEKDQQQRYLWVVQKKDYDKNKD